MPDTETMLAGKDPGSAMPSPLMDGLHRLRSTSLELRSRLHVVLERQPAEDSQVEAKPLEDKALDVIADTQDILGDIMSRLIV